MILPAHRGRCTAIAASVTMVLGCLATPALAQPTIVESRFEADAEGWTIATILEACEPPAIGNVGAVTYFATGGNPGGYARYSDNADSRTAYWQAPAPFLGDLAAAYGGALSFDLRQSSVSSQYNTMDVIIQGNGLSLFWDTPNNPRSRWTRYHLPLVPGDWRLGACDGPVATSADIQLALASVTRILIRAEYRSGADTDSLDNVVIIGPTQGTPTSTFDAAAEDWWVLNDGEDPVWNDSLGNPGGCLSVTDQVLGDCWRFHAPAKFLGDRSAALGSTIGLDILAEGMGACGNQPLITLTGAGITLQHIAPPDLGSSQWRRYAVPLVPTAAWTRLPGGGTPSPEDFQTVLASLNDFTILGEVFSGDDRGLLDNVSFGGCEPAVDALGPAAPVCRAGAAVLTAIATGTAPMYQWQRETSPGSGDFVALADGPTISWDGGTTLGGVGAIVSGATTATLTIAADLDAGRRLAPSHTIRYRCAVSNDCGAIASDPVEFSLCNADTNCDGAVNSGDISAFLTEWLASVSGSDLAADFNADGLANSGDISAFLTAWLAAVQNGC